MNVGLIDATFYHQDRLMKLRRIGYFPLTLPRMAAYFPPGTNVRLFYEKCQEVPLNEPFDLVFFTTMGSNLARAVELSAEFRKRGIRTVVGGYSVAPLLDYCREHFDACVIGDAEGLIPKICEDAHKGTLAAVYENRNPDLTTLPAPRLDLIDPAIIGDIFPLEASRGCRNACDFCLVTNLYHSCFRERRVDEVLKEFHQAKKAFGKRLYFFTDANFTADMPHAKAVLQGLVGQGVLWIASVDLRSLQDDEFLALARKSGCFGLQIGLESLSAKKLAEVNKGFAANLDYRTLIKRAQNAGIPIVALLMFGFDDDTPATFPEMRRFLEKFHIPLAVPHPITPIPGTPLYKKMQQEHRLLPMDPKLVDGLHVLFQPKHFSPEALTEEYWKFCASLLSLRSIVRRFLWPGFLKNPIAYLLLLITNFLARGVVAKKLPPGMYE